jgi:hypothetical protein
VAHDVPEKAGNLSQWSMDIVRMFHVPSFHVDVSSVSMYKEVDPVAQAIHLILDQILSPVTVLQTLHHVQVLSSTDSAGQAASNIADS